MNIYDVALALTPRVGAQTAAHLIDKLFSAQNIFSLSLSQLQQQVQLNEAVAAAIVNQVAMDDAQAQIDHCAKHNIEIIAAVDPAYPPLLREIHNPPHVIYVQGDSSILTRNMISFVGTRKMTSYGERATIMLIEEAAKKIHNLVIVSGLAYGIDSVAHRAALKCGVPTVAVIPSSLPSIIPTQHTSLAREIVEAGGAIISEMSVQQPNNGRTFIARNRLIAGMAAATIVVESQAKGGSMHTAEMAAAAGRIVGAVPGRLTDAMSRGCHALISSRSAIPITSAEDLIRELNWSDRRIDEGLGRVVIKSASNEANNIVESLTPDQREVVASFVECDPIHIDLIEQRTKIGVAKLTGCLMELELLGVVRMLPGSRYERLVEIGSEK